MKEVSPVYFRKGLCALFCIAAAAALLFGCAEIPGSSGSLEANASSSTPPSSAALPDDAVSQPGPADSSSVPVYIPAEGDITEEQALQIWDGLAPLYEEYAAVFDRDGLPFTNEEVQIEGYPYPYYLCGESAYTCTDDLRALLDSMYTPEYAASKAEQDLAGESPLYVDYEGRLYRAFVQGPNSGVDPSIPGRLISSSDSSFVLELQSFADNNERTTTWFTIVSVDGVWLIDRVQYIF